MEFELFISGIGGQGVQLMCKTLALAATHEQRHAMFAAEYGGEMRGGSSLGAVVVGSERLRALPVVPHAGSAIALHHKFWDQTAKRLRPDSLIVAESGIADQLVESGRHRLIRIPAVKIATDVGSPLAAGLALLGAYNAITGLVETDSLVAAMAQLIPSYRSQHIAANERAIRAGAEHAPKGAALVNLPLRPALEATS